MTDTLRASIAREAAQFLARIVSQHLVPPYYQRVHLDGGREFRVTVEELTRGKTVPIWDEDDRIAD